MSKETREYAKQLVSQMTLEEKMSQMVYQSPAIERLGIPAYNWWNEALHGVARAGVATVFPQAIGLAATFDKELLQEIGDVVSTEGRAKFNEFSRKGDRGIYKGLTFWAPNVNIFRDPRWGRGHEADVCTLGVFLHLLLRLIFRQSHPNFINVRTAYASEIWAQLTKNLLTKSSIKRFREYIRAY